MKEDSYPFEAYDLFRRYEFFSEGPRGRILKCVRYEDVEDDIYTLGFGDVIGGMIHDDIVTDNKDTKKVLTTVGLTLYEFFKKYPLATVYGSGTDVRIRLYQMAISNNLDQLEKYFTLRGQIGTKWFRFEKNQNYERFMIQKKPGLYL